MTTLKVTQPVTYSRVLGVGGVRGERVVTNDDIAGPINSSDEWIRQRTGIVTRRRAAEDTSLLDMCEGAGRAAIAASGVDPADIDVVILGTITYLEQTPAAAPSSPRVWGSTPPRRTTSPRPAPGTATASARRMPSCAPARRGTSW